MNKYLFKIVFALLLACTQAYVWAGEGESCSNPIALGTDYNDHIPGACTIWYIANMSDLPLTVRYYPADNMAAPDLYMDFSCESGVYDDSIICSLFCKDLPGTFPLPYHVTPVWKQDEDNNVYYEVSMGTWYRDVLLQHGISYHVQIFIKAIYYGEGDIVLSPDAEFSQCMETEDWLLFGRTLPVAAEDPKTYFIAPYSNWENDSVRYIWQGDYPAMVTLGTSCDFDPLDATDEKLVDVMHMKAGADTAKHTTDDIAHYITYMNNPTNTAKGGIFYVKVYSEGEGTLKVEHIPTPDPEGDATVLQYGQEATVERNNTDKLYAITKTWKKATLFTTPTHRVMRMYVGKTYDFAIEDAIASYHFAPSETGHELALFAKEMEALWWKAIGDYLYIRIECSEKTTIKPLLWTPNECALKTPRLEAPSLTMELPRKTDAVYSLLYSDWKGGNWTFYWDANTQSCFVTLGDSCAQISSLTDPHAFASHTIANKQQWVIPAYAVDTMEKYVDEDGYLYICFYGGQKANITITTSAQEEVDPPCAPYDSVCTTSAWDSIWWCGTKYTESGEYHYNPGINEDNGCIDTLYTLHLTIHTTGYASMSDTGCDSLVFNGHKYTVSGVYKDTTLLDDGNRVVTTRDLTIHHTTYGAIAEQACEVYISPSGKEYIYPGTYNDTITNAIGCDSVIQIELALIEDCRTYDTIFFCEGFNYEHDEVIRPDWVNRYRPYVYESPAEWNYMDGVELQHDGGKTLMDLHKAEENLYEHYTGSLTPITAISWSHRPEGKKTYEPITVENEPQWIEAGSLALRLQFLCGETYSTSYVTDIDNVDADATPVKRIENGRVIILRGGVRYDMLGNVIK